MKTPGALLYVPRGTQHGIVLAISLLLLLVLTLIGIAVTRSTTLDERLTSDRRDQEVAFQVAEAALREGESLLQGVSRVEFNNTNGLYDRNAAITWQHADWSNAGNDPALKTIPYDGRLDPRPASAPSFYIVKISMANPAPGSSRSTDTSATISAVYEIYARGVDPSGKHAVILESFYAMPVPNSNATGGRLSWQQLQ